MTSCGGSDPIPANPLSSIDSPPIAATPDPSTAPVATATDSGATAGPVVGTFVRPKDVIVTVDQEVRGPATEEDDANRIDPTGLGKILGVAKVSNVIVDDQSTGFQRSGQMACKNNTPCWGQSSAGYNGHSWWTWNNTKPSYGKWMPSLACPGNYQVSAYIPSLSSPTSSAKYTVQYQSGPGYKTIPQSSYSNQWVSLGTYNFGTSGSYVELHNVTGETPYTKRVGFDAVKWVWDSPTGTLTVTSPNGGETWTKASSGCVNVTWDSNGLSDTIRIHLHKGGTSSGNYVKSLVDTTTNDGSYCVPMTSLAGLADGSDYYIGMSNVNSYCDGVVSDFSNGPFTIKTPANVNLTPKGQAGWTAALVVSNVTGTNTSTPNALTYCKPTYIDWAVANTGTNATSTTFYTKLYLDNNEIESWYTSGLPNGESTFIQDFAYTVSAGTHTLKLVTDVGGDVSESNEGDNTYTQSFTWGGCAPTTTTITTNNGVGFLTDQNTVAIKGTCTPATGDSITSIEIINLTTSDYKKLGGATNFTFDSMTLVDGPNLFKVTCYGTGSASGQDSITITLNRKPTFTISTNSGNNFSTAQSNATISGECNDPDGNIDYITYENISTGWKQVINNPVNDNAPFSEIFPLKNGQNNIFIECWDTYGKSSGDGITVTSNQAGAISGTITSGGASVGSGATIVASGPIQAVAGSDSGGNYTLSGLPAGTYDLKANKAGYAEAVKTGISVSTGSTTTVHFSLTKIPSPVFIYSPSNIGVTMNSGNINASQSLIIKNNGDAPLEYTPSSNVAWASLQKNGASITGTKLVLAPGAQDTLIASFNSNGITSSQQGKITIQHNDKAQGNPDIFLGMGINAPPPQPPPPAEQPPPSTPIFQPSLYGQCPAQNACYADPVNTAIGNYLYHHTDLAIVARGPGLIFAQNYNSLDATTGPLGLGWTHSLNIHLILAGNGDVYVRWGDGKVDGYKYNSSTGGYSPPAGIYDQLTKGNSYILTDKEQYVWVFSAEGQLQTVTDQFNNKLTLSYDSQRRLASATNAVGDQFTFTYVSNTDPKLASVADFTGRKVQFAYSGNLLTQTTDVMGKSFGYTYDSGNRLKQIVERDGKTLVSNTYDGSGRVTNQYDALNNHTQLAYDTPSAGQTTVTDPAGNQHVYSYDALYRLITQTIPTGDKVTYLYNTQNLPVEVTDATGSKTFSS
jgi:YD repeat-containing protein